MRNIFSSSFFLIAFLVENYNANLFFVNFEPSFLIIPKILFPFILFLIIPNVLRWLPVTPLVFQAFFLPSPKEHKKTVKILCYKAYASINIELVLIQFFVLLAKTYERCGYTDIGDSRNEQGVSISHGYTCA